MTTFATRAQWSKLDDATLARLTDRQGDIPPDVLDAVADIEARVLEDGDVALKELATELDGAALDELLVPPERLEAAWDELPRDVQNALEVARETLGRYHRSTLPPAGRVDDAVGLSCTWRFDALERAGIYVPGGHHPYPSTLLMAAVPAAVADVNQIWLASPPSAGGDIHPAVLAAAHLMGIEHVVRAGGAQAIFALAHGTETVTPCDVVVGPGNQYVQAAKRSVAGQCRIDSPAGPSEVLVLADEEAEPERIAAELVAQAEHGATSFCTAIVPTDEMADAVETAVDGAAKGLATSEAALKALSDRGALLVEPDMDAQVSAANQIAPEHLVVLRADSGDISNRLTTAGCLFIGSHATVPLGDYVAGPSHILPTGGSARSYSGLAVDTFLRRTNVVSVQRAVPPRLAKATRVLAEFEGLPGHAAALKEADHSG